MSITPVRHPERAPDDKRAHPSQPGSGPRPSRLIRAGLVVSLALSCAGLAGAQSPPAGRRFTVEDWLTNERVTDVAFAEDGRALAYTRQRPQNSPRQDYRFDQSRGGDVWVQLDAGQPPRNVTRGSTDGSSWWEPLWSPDGRRLAMRSTRSGRVSVWLWERETGRLRELVAEPLAGDQAQVEWVDPDRLLVQVRAAGDTLMDRYPSPPPGDGRTASVLEAGVGARRAEWPWAQGPLLLVDLRDGTRRIVAASALKVFVLNDHARAAQVSPDRRWVATPRVTRILAPTGDLPPGFHWDPMVLAVEVHGLDGPPPKFAEPLPVGMKPRTLRWSGDGRELAYVQIDPERSGAPRLVIARPGEGRVETLALDSLGDGRRHQFTRFEAAWTARSEVWLETRPLETGYHGEPTCWLVSRRGAMRRASLPEKRRLLAPDTAARLVERLEKTVPKPSPSAKLVAAAPTGSSAVFVEDGLRGLTVWRVAVPSGRTDTLVVANTHLRDVALGTWEAVRYASRRGDTLLAHLLRPAGVPPGVRVPLVVEVYQSSVMREDGLSRRAGADNYVSFLHQTFAGYGMAVLVPSMPYDRSTQGQGSATWLSSVPDGVLPAVDTAIARGIADPDRLFVTGHSTGGFSAVSLVAQTNRFKAAVGSAGYYNLTSNWGTHRNDTKWIETGPVNTYWQALFLEARTRGRPALGGPPWRRPQEYVANSPFFRADSIRTPILLLHGDLDDAVAITQSEEMFTALWRQGKRARFVRYWGEHHGLLHRPSTVRDVYYQQFAWFDEFGDIARDDQGNIIWEGGRAKSRAGGPPLGVADYARFDRGVRPSGAGEARRSP